MGRKAERKQGPPRPLPGSDMAHSGKKPNRKRSKSGGSSEVKSLKSTGPGSKHAQKKMQKEIKRRVKAVDRVDEDSDIEEALKPG